VAFSAIAFFRRYAMNAGAASLRAEPTGPLPAMNVP
jgi:hypothetical protein